MLNQLVELDLLDKHFDAARQRIRRQFQKNPDSPVAHFLEGKILAAEGKWDQPRQSFKRRSSSIRISRAPTISWSRAYLATNKLPQAVSQLQALLVEEPQ